jgi:Bacteriophage Lambda NinG protein
MQDAICEVCKKPFKAWNSIVRVCGYRCAAKLPKQERKAERAKDRATRERLKTRAQWLAEAQATVNRYVRLRDYRLGCVSCDKPPSWPGQWHASHFRSVGAASAVRFSLWNIHKSCSVCNNWRSGNLSEYEPRLRARIGDDKVDWLRAQNQRVTYSVEYLRRLKSVFARKARRAASRV